MSTRIKVHPIGYIPIKGKRIQNVSNGRYIRRHQTITQEIDVDLPIYDKQGNPTGNYVHTKHIQTKTIYHTEPSVKRGKTLGEIYWDSVLNSPNYIAYQNKFRKRKKTL